MQRAAAGRTHVAMRSPEDASSSSRGNGPQRALAAFRARVAARTVSLAVVSLVLASCLAVLLAAPALAARGHVFSKTFASKGAGPGQLENPAGVAVNELTGDVYVADKGNHRVQRFSSEGVFQSEITGSSATGTGALEENSTTIKGAAATAGVFSVGQEITAPGLQPETTITGTPGGGVLEISKPAKATEPEATLAAHQGFSEPDGIAVDNSCQLHKPAPLTESTTPTCAESDPSHGDIYVADVGRNAVLKFTATGAYLGQITQTRDGVSFEQLWGVAVNAQGQPLLNYDVRRVGETLPEVETLNNHVVNGFDTAIVAAAVARRRPGFAVDGKGNLYEFEKLFGHSEQRVAKLANDGSVITEELVPHDSTAVTVDPATDSVYVDNVSFLTSLDRAGALSETFGAGQLVAGTGMGIDSRTETLYVADAGTGSVVVFAPEPPGRPTVEETTFSEVTAESTTFTATINPRGASARYRFEYGTCATVATCKGAPFPSTAPAAEPPTGSDFEVHTVSIHVQELAAHTAYHFRVVATNEHSAGAGTRGEEQVFVTQTSGEPFSLPDGRAWELVSPPDKQGSKIESPHAAAVFQAAADGSALTYLANAPTEPAAKGNANLVQVLSTRRAAAWSSRDIAAPHEHAPGPSTAGSEYVAFSEDLSQAVLQPFGGFTPAISGEASEQTAYLRNNFPPSTPGSLCAAECYRPLVTGKAPYANVPGTVRFGDKGGPQFVGATPDMTHILLQSNAALVEGATGTALYEWAAGKLTLIGSNLADHGFYSVSSDGARVVYGENGGSGLRLLSRNVTTGQTVQLDAPARTCKETCKGGAGEFQAASTDGRTIFFTDSNALTPDSGAEEKRPDLYVCEITEAEGKPRCEPQDLTPLGAGGEHATVMPQVLGSAADGSAVYVTANGRLAPDATQAGTCDPALTVGNTNCNLYVVRRVGGEWLPPRFIAVLSGNDGVDWGRELKTHTSRVSPNGEWLAFNSQQRLLRYDNRDVITGKGDQEVYLYHASTGTIACASCNPTGARPSGGEGTQAPVLFNGPRIWTPGQGVAATLPGWTAYIDTAAVYQSRYLSDTGRLFFNAHDALVPGDINNQWDVYQYEPPHVGGCTEASPTFSDRSGGCVGLISSGTSPEESAFLDASAKGGRDPEGHEGGGDVFFLTASKLNPQDFDTSLDVYDAHECAPGAPACYPAPAETPPPCGTGDSCKPAPTPQPDIFGLPASGTFTGLGNTPPPPPGRKTPAQVRAAKLAAALKTCRNKHNRHRRHACETKARKAYGPKSRKASTTRGGR